MKKIALTDSPNGGRTERAENIEERERKIRSARDGVSICQYRLGKIASP